METICCLDKNKCTGCSACFNICPKGAIFMQEDSEGFPFPFINKDLCVNCGKCYDVCPAINMANKNDCQKVAYAVSASDSIRKNSSSGGAFVLIAEEIINLGGYVCGAAYNPDFEVEHIIIDKKEDLSKLQGSKYSQSDLTRCFSNLKNLLEDDKYVLFSGTPCQVAGLKNFLQKDYEKLFTADLVCHGIPSPKVFRKYLSELKENDEEKIQKINFRDKVNGWDYSNVLKVTTDKNVYTYESRQSAYFDAFGRDLIERKSCEECLYATSNRVGDFTIGDFWGINQICYQLNDTKGISILLANTEKAQNLLKFFKNRCLVLSEIPFEQAKVGNQVFSKPFPAHRNRDKFFENLDKWSIKENVDYCLNDCADVGILNFWWFPNYGANLTAYSLQETIKSFGFKTKLIDYKHYWGTTGFSDNFYEDLHKDTFAQRFAERYLDTTEPIKSEKDYKCLNNRINTFVVGSDQVFRSSFVGNTFEKYFLGFTTADKKRIAFSASFGKDMFEGDLDTIKKVGNYLKRFDYISTREDSGCTICEKMFDVKADCTIEPVFLFDRKYWENFAAKSEVDCKGQIATYYFETRDKNLKLARFLQNKYKKDVAIVNDSDVDVEDFIKVIQTCEFLVTNSFHGVCFALLFNKPICLIGKNINANRISSIFKRFGIDYDFSIDEDDFDKLFINYDYETVCKNIKEFREYSLNKLKEALFKPKTKINNVEDIRKEQIYWDMEAKIEANSNEALNRDNDLNNRYNDLNNRYNILLCAFNNLNVSCCEMQNVLKNTLKNRLKVLWRTFKIYIKQ